MLKRLPLIAKVLLGMIAVPALLIVLMIAVWQVSNGLKYGWSNYAEEAHRPIDEYLIAHGFAKECGYGDPGHGIDNLSPWYKSYYTYAGNQDSTHSIMSAAASTAGFELTQTLKAIEEGVIDHPASSSLPDTGDYIDTRQPSSPYEPYTDGSMEFKVKLYNKDSAHLSYLWCGGSKDRSLQGAENFTVVETTLSLPRYNKK